jgi:hypothetical protein
MGSLRFSHVGHMDHRVLEAVTVEGLAAGALHQRTRSLRRKLLAGFPHRVFPRGPVAIVAPLLEISFSSSRYKKTAHAHPKSARAWSNVAAVSFVHSRGWLPG